MLLTGAKHLTSFIRTGQLSTTLFLFLFLVATELYVLKREVSRVLLDGFRVYLLHRAENYYEI